MPLIFYKHDMNTVHYESQGSIQEQKSGSAGHEDEGIHWT